MSKSARACLVASSLLASQAGLHAYAQSTPATMFGQRPMVEGISLSPDGNKIAFVSPGAGQGATLFVARLADGAGAIPQPALIANGNPNRIQGCDWVTNARLICTIFAVVSIEGNIRTDLSRMVALDENGANQKELMQRRSSSGDALAYNLSGGQVIDWLPDAQDGTVLVSRYYAPEFSTGTRLAQAREGLAVDRINTVSLASSTQEQPRGQADRYITDGHGVVRIMGIAGVKGATGQDSGLVRYSFRRKGSKEWEPLSTWDEPRREGFFPVGVDRDQDSVFGFKKQDGRLAAWSISLDGKGTEKLLFAHPQVDVASFLRIGRQNRMIGVSYVTEERYAVYFDQPMAKLASSLAKALPSLPQIGFLDASLDENKLLILAASDVDAGRYYVFDKVTRKLAEVMLQRPQLEKVSLAAMKAVTYPAADGVQVPGYLMLPPGKETAKGLPAIVMPHGGPSARDEWGFDWLAQYYANQGYAVLQPNFRGSAGYGDAWFQENGFRSWRTAVGDVDAAGRWLVAQGIAAPDKLAIVGWSYGGYAALQSAVTNPGLFKAVIAIAPVTDLGLLMEQARNWSNFSLTRDFIGEGPHVEAGSPARHAREIKAPILLFHGTADRNVDINQSRLLAGRLKDAGVTSELVVYEGLDHYLEDSTARTDMLTRSAAFLAKALKP